MNHLSGHHVESTAKKMKKKTQMTKRKTIIRMIKTTKNRMKMRETKTEKTKKKKKKVIYFCGSL